MPDRPITPERHPPYKPPARGRRRPARSPAPITRSARQPRHRRTVQGVTGVPPRLLQLPRHRPITSPATALTPEKPIAPYRSPARGRFGFVQHAVTGVLAARDACNRLCVNPTVAGNQRAREFGRANSGSETKRHGSSRTPIVLLRTRERGVIGAIDANACGKGGKRKTPGGLPPGVFCKPVWSVWSAPEVKAPRVGRSSNSFQENLSGAYSQDTESV